MVDWLLSEANPVARRPVVWTFGRFGVRSFLGTEGHIDRPEKREVSPRYWRPTRRYSDEGTLRTDLMHSGPMYINVFAIIGIGP